MSDDDDRDVDARRRSFRRKALLLGALALGIYVGYILWLTAISRG